MLDYYSKEMQSEFICVLPTVIIESRIEDFWVISKRTHHKRVSRKMIRVMEKQMYATVSDSRGEEFAVSAG